MTVLLLLACHSVLRGHLCHLFRVPDRPSETEEIPVFSHSPLVGRLDGVVVHPRAGNEADHKPFAYSRDYVEFLIYDAKHHIRAEVRNTYHEYKKWPLYKPSGTDFSIVYDVTDETLKEDGTRLYDDAMADPVACSTIFSVGEPFLSCPRKDARLSNGLRNSTVKHLSRKEA